MGSSPHFPSPALPGSLSEQGARLLERLLAGGVRAETAPRSVKRIRQLNAVALSFAGVCLSYFPVLLALGVATRHALFLPAGAALFGVSLGLNHRGHFGRARRLYYLNACGLVLAFTCLDRTAGLHLLFIAFTFMPFVLYGLEERLTFWLALAVPVVVFGALHVQGEALLPPPMVPEPVSALLRQLPLPTLLLCVLLAAFHLCVENERAERLLRETVERLRQETQARVHQEQVAADAQEKARLARAAGMAEIATGVLHNVGHVLNSVNVSSGLLEDRLRQGHGPRLHRSAELLRSGGLQSPEKQAALARYLEALGDEAERERAELGAEVVGLRQHVNHIHSVVALQQNFARSLGVVEAVYPREVAEEALTLCASARLRHGISLVVSHEELPVVQLDRHKVLQILVNLLRNATDAMRESPPDRRRLEVRTARRGDALVFEVIDNGCGIAGEDLRRVFSHGFTTKSDGHGFGLHASGLLATEMHGGLGCRSAGPGQGSTFTLSLPFREASPS